MAKKPASNDYMYDEEYLASRYKPHADFHTSQDSRTGPVQRRKGPRAKSADFVKQRVSAGDTHTPAGAKVYGTEKAELQVESYRSRSADDGLKRIKK